MSRPGPRRLAAALLPLALGLLPACQQKMAVQPSYRPDQVSPFFFDGRAARPSLPGRVARGHLRTDRHLFGDSGRDETRRPEFPGALIGSGGPLGRAALIQAVTAGQESSTIDTFPFPVTAEVLRHGHDRYTIYCVVCHDPLGTGQGKIVERGYTPPPSYHIERLRGAPVGHFFDVITRGYGSMPSYRKQVPPRDRWAIIAYIRALQLSQHFPERELTDSMREAWSKQGGQP